MNQPTECKHCGLHATWHIDDDTVCACGTIYAGRGDCWNQSTGCVEIVQFRERIKRAVEVLEGARRYDFVDGYLPCMSRRSDGEFLEHEQAEQVIEILKGETDGQTD